MTKQKIIIIKARFEARMKLRELTAILNKNIGIGKVSQLDALDYALDTALKAFKDG